MPIFENKIIGAYPILTKAEYQQIVIDWNKTENIYPKDKTIHQLFEEQVAKTPDNIAVVYEEQQLTYQALNEKANQLARYIRKQPATELIAICMDRSLQMVIAILGVLKAGCAYVPIDPKYPQERIDYIRADSKAGLLLDNGLKETFYQRESKENVGLLSGPNDLAYVIYTSGTTGKPKGVMVEHKDLVFYQCSFNALLNHELIVSAFTLSYCFDASLPTLFSSLISGGKVVVTKDLLEISSADYFDQLRKHGVNTIRFTPSLLSGVIDELLKYQQPLTVVLGGEVYDEKLVNLITNHDSIRLYNQYGPTEAVVGSTIRRLSKDARGQLIGKPYPGKLLYVLDGYLNPTPIGAIGELYIGGAGLARGYLNQPERTKACFIPNPFGEGRIYKTGDLVRWLSDGNLEYIGRNDSQVKIRGYRIELGEIENTLRHYSDVSEAVVQVFDNQLIAYIVAGEFTPSVTELEEFLAETLPEYMLPSHFVFLDKVPLTMNGKLDRKALPLPDFTQAQDLYLAARDEVEALVCQIWQQALNIPRVGIEDDFFRLGGHSILAIQVTHKMSRALKRPVLVADIFKHRTIAKLCSVLKGYTALQNITPIKDNPSPLSFAQERLWFIEQYEGGTDVYHNPILLRREDHLIESLQRVIQRHAILRTRFVIDEEGHYLQEVHHEPLPIEKNINPEEFVHRVFDLTKSHPLRAGFYKEYLLIVFHHIAFDAWSGLVLQKELKSKDLPLLEIQYKDFAVWQRDLVESKKEELLGYWKTKLADTIPLQMPTDYPRPVNFDYKGASVNFTLPNALKNLSTEYNVTPYAILLAGLAITLSRYTGQTDLTIGTPVANRQHPQLEHLIGFFLNTLVLRIQLDPSHTLSQCINQIQTDLIEAQLYQDMPFEMLVDELSVERDTSRHPLFQVMYTVQYGDVDEHEENNSPLNYEVAKFDLSVFLYITPNHIKASINYATALFKQDTMERFIRHYQQILQVMLTDKDKAIGAYPILTPAEYQQIVIDWNQAKKAYPQDKTISQLFEEQAAKTPNHIAVVFDGQHLTYKALNEESNQLARYIRKQGPSELIAICMDRSLEMVVAILGVLKAGCAYVPIDPHYPKERIDYILADTRASLVLDNDLKEKPYQKESKRNLTSLNTPESLAYVMFTSGSTGVPKGVSISHQNALNTLHAINEQFHVNDQDKVLALSEFHFDLSVYDILGLLIIGGQVIIPVSMKEPKHWHELIRTHEITLWNSVPSLMELLLDEIEETSLSLRAVLLSGDKISLALASQVRQSLPEASLMSLGGATEGSIWSIGHEIEEVHPDWMTVPYGRALPNQQMYVLDAGLNPCPIGVRGEICIGGAGVALGYWNNEVKTQQQFVHHRDFGRIYRTGDLGAWHTEGYIEYHGRNDSQVKIRGYRVELGDIESALSTHPEIKQVLVITHDAKLIAYYVGAIQENLNTYLSQKLPEYMIPSAFISMESFPLTMNGKLDRKALPLPDFTQAQDLYLAARDEVEAIVCQIWQQALNIPRVGIEDDFFRLGGHSILAIQVTHKMSRALKRPVLVADIFKYRTIAKLCSVLKGYTVLQNITPIKDNPSPLSFAQERLWFIEQYEGGTDVYHNPILLQREEHLIESLQRVIQRHAILRTRFVINEEGHYLQEVHHEPLPIEENINPDEFIHRVFDLTKGHPLRAGLYKEYLLIVFHHIAFDAWSGFVLQKELKSKDLPLLEIQYKDFAVWQRDLVESKKEELLGYWKTKLADTIPLQMPTDYPRPVNVDYKGASLNFTLPNALKNLSTEYNVTPYAILLTGLAITLSRYTGQTDLTIGTPVANRQHPQLEHLIGFFVNTLVLRIQLDSSHTLSQCINQIQTDLIEAQLYQDMPFEMLVDELNVERDTSRHPLFQVMYTVQYGDVDEHEENNSPLHYEVAKFDLSVSLYITPNQIKANINYASSLFKQDTMERFITHYQQILQVMLTDKDKAISAYPILTQAEYQQIVIDWNKTENIYPRDKTIHQLFEEQAAKTPDNIAVVYEEQQLTYQALNEKANQLARYIRKQPATELIAICMDRSLQMVIAILGVLKAGCAYVPIDPKSPQERIDYIRADSKAGLLLDNGLKETFYQRESKENVRALSGPNDLAYVIYTSGTTGKPKGVMVEHKDLVFYQCSFNALLNHELIVSAFTLSYCFDASLPTLFSSLISGGKVVVTKDLLEISSADYFEQLRKHGVNTIRFTPSLLSGVIDGLRKYQHPLTVVLGGEMYDERLVSLITNHDSIRLYNQYGPTEAVVGSTIRRLSKDTRGQLIGKPYPGKLIYVLDGYLNPTPIGAIGELYIGGAGLARGYLNQPELTKACFIPNPFGEGRLYKTGDLVRWLSDGNLEYIGRNDSQVKIRGYRIELSEIETALSIHPDIKQVAIIAHHSKLIAYYVGQPRDKLNVYLGHKLPEYMIPSMFIEMESFPLTINNKLDRKNLPLPDLTQNQDHYIAPRNEIESNICNIWQQVLNVSQVGIEDDFFKLGGHSILAIQVAHKMSRALKQNVLVADIFKYRMIATMCDALKNHETLQLIEPIQKNPSPLSFAQERLWFIEQYEGGTNLYHIPNCYVLNQSIDIDALKYALQSIVSRHTILRTYFIQNQLGECLQSRQKHPLPIIELRVNASKFEETVAEAANRVFDLTREYPIRAWLCTVIETQQCYLLLTFHHIVFDGWSHVIFKKELIAHYHKQQLPPIEIQYSDFAVWQRNYLSKHLNELMPYWHNKFLDFTPLVFPTDFARPAEIDYRGHAIRLALSEERLLQLEELAEQQQVTLFTVLLTAFVLVLSRYTGKYDVVLGTLLTNRQHPQLEPLIGFFLNNMALRIQLEPSLTMLDCIGIIHNELLELQSHQDVPFEKLVTELGVERDPSRHPLFQIMFTYQNFIEEEHNVFDDLLKPLSSNQHHAAPFELMVSVLKSSQKMVCVIRYAVALFKPETIERLQVNYQNTLAEMINKPEQPICYYPMLPIEERHKITIDWNKTECDFPKDKTIYQLFEEQVQRTPNKLAVTDKDNSLTYIELNNAVILLANRLDIQPGDIVVLESERNIEYLCHMLAVWKAGAAFIPMDPGAPAERNQEIREQVKHAPKVSHLAYIIFTSGSTGKPKGAMVHQVGAVNHLFAKIRDFNITENDNIAQTATQTFDVSIWQFMAALIVGGRITILTEDDAWVPEKLFSHIDIQKITLLESVPSHLPLMLDPLIGSYHLSSLRYLIMNGEGLPVALCRQWFANYPNTPMANVYGPTECSDDVAHYIFNKIDTAWQTYVPIGRPIQNMRLYILDHHLNPMPVGATGELYVAGIGVGLGYLGLVEKTQETFIDNNPLNSRLYKTGDLARWTDEGIIEYLGRSDFQVKIHGQRIELGEIESILLTHPDIKQVAVVAHDSKLLAYYVGQTRDNLNDYLHHKLPNYMIPSVFIAMDSFPLLMNGKLDRDAFILPNFTLNQSEYIAPRNSLEMKIAKVWQSVLKLERIGIQDDFFQLGGDSIQTIQVSGRLQREGLDIHVKDLFTYSTIQKLAENLNKMRPIYAEQGFLTGSFALLPIQQWFFSRALKSPNHYNQSFIVHIPDLSVTRLTEIPSKLMEQHDVLHLCFKDGQQTYMDNLTAPPLKVAKDFNACTSWQSHFNLEEGPLWQMGYIEGGYLFFAAHHLIIDAVSWRILIDDIQCLYAGGVLGPKSSSYRQWVAAVWNYPNQYPNERDYWEAQMVSSSHIPLMDSFSSADCEWDETVTQQLLTLANKAYHTEINDLLLTALAYTLHSWSGLESNSITLEGHGREVIDETIDVSRTVGWFTTRYPVKLTIKESLSESIQHIKDHLHSIPNKGIGFGAFFSKTELSDITSFNYFGQFDSQTGAWQVSDKASGQSNPPENKKPNLLTLDGMVMNHRLRFRIISYTTAATQIAEAFKANLTNIIQHCVEGLNDV